MAAPAVKAARGKTDLIKAIKEFYSAASAYCENGVPMNRIQEAQTSRQESDYRAKGKALDLEMNLAGIK